MKEMNYNDEKYNNRHVNIINNPVFSPAITWYDFEKNKTFVMMTHNQHDANYSGKIINLFDGQIMIQS